MNTLLNKEWLLQRLMNTVGYVESENKEEFLKGAGMIIDKVLQIATDETNYLYEKLEEERSSHSEVRQDIVTLAEILRKYTSETQTNP